MAVWQPLAGRLLGPDDTRQIVQNVTGFFRVLAEWDSPSGATLPAPDGIKTIVPGTEPAA